jgi:hypothetical protein
MTTADVVEHIDHFQRRVIQDAIADADATYWLRRAEMFEAARPRAGDYHGRATRADLAAADQRCRDAAEACRKRAAVSIRGAA